MNMPEVMNVEAFNHMQLNVGNAYISMSKTSVTEPQINYVRTVHRKKTLKI